VAYNAPITGAPLPWLVTDSASSLQAGLGDEVADTAAEVVIDANAVQLVLGNELVNPGAGNAEHLGGQIDRRPKQFVPSFRSSGPFITLTPLLHRVTNLHCAPHFFAKMPGSESSSGLLESSGFELASMRACHFSAALTEIRVRRPTFIMRGPNPALRIS